MRLEPHPQLDLGWPQAELAAGQQLEHRQLELVQVQSQVRLAAGRLLERRQQELALGLELGLVPAQLAVELGFARRVGHQLAVVQAEGLALPERPQGQPLVRAVGPPAVMVPLVMGLLEPPGTCPEQPQCTEWCFAQAELGTEPELALA